MRFQWSCGPLDICLPYLQVLHLISCQLTRVEYNDNTVVVWTPQHLQTCHASGVGVDIS